MTSSNFDVTDEIVVDVDVPFLVNTSIHAYSWLFLDFHSQIRYNKTKGALNHGGCVKRQMAGN